MPRRSVLFDLGGSTGIMCGSFKASDICADCNSRLKVALCDAPVGHGKTCDRPICGRCRHHVGKNTDYCKQHAGAIDTQQPLFNGPQVPIEVKG